MHILFSAFINRGLYVAILRFLCGIVHTFYSEHLVLLVIFWNPRKGATGISFSSVNARSFSRTNTSDTGLQDGAEVFDSVRYPTEILYFGSADNFASGRDGLMVFRFVIPESQVSQNEFKITAAMGAISSPTTFGMNVGGTFGGTGDRTFTGGSTVYGGGSTTEYEYASLSGVTGTYDGLTETYSLDVQFGYTGVGDSGVVAVRGMTVSVIPEPGTLALVGLALGTLLIFRRRR
jgi:hypothetical protein